MTGDCGHSLLGVALNDIDRGETDGWVLRGDVVEETVDGAQGGRVVACEVIRHQVSVEPLAAGGWTGFVVAIQRE